MLIIVKVNLVRTWAFQILLRLAELLGIDFVQKKLKANIRVHSLFSGVDGPKHACAFIQAACVELWGFSPNIYFDFSAAA